MYKEIAAMTNDVARIAKNTGIPEHYIAKVKEHLFLREHELEVANYTTQEITREKGNFTLPDKRTYLFCWSTNTAESD